MALPPITTKVNRASFSILSKEEIKQISVKKITEPKSFGKAGTIDQNGLYSLALGPVKRFEICTTCGLPDSLCPGHYGHIELSVPVYHPMLVQTMYQLLSKCCLECYHFRLSSSALALFLRQLEALNNGFDHLIEEFDDIAKDLCRDDKNGSDEYLTVTLAQKLSARIKEEKDKTPEFDCQKRPQQRSIVETLTKLFRNFINGHLIKPQKVCANCGEKKMTMSLHQQSVLVIGANSSKPIDDDLDLTGKKKGGANSSSKKSKKKKRSKSDDTSLKFDGLQYLKTDEKKFLTPIGAQNIFRQLWKNEKATLKSMFHFLNVPTDQPDKGKSITHGADDDDDDNDPKELMKLESQFQPIDLFFIDTILVPPGKFRPPMSQRGYIFEGPRTAALANVMKQSVIVKDCIDKLINEIDEVEAEKLQPKLQAHWKDLQVAVNCLFDNEMDKYNSQKTKYPGLKQLIDKKEGLFRKNMMGKRVNFAARSVISPDPNISVDQIGVPLVFAKRLTYPQPVTPWNLQQLKECVLNGPDKYPGATSVVYDDGATVSLVKESVRENVAARLSYNPRHTRSNRDKPDTSMATIVNRHLVDGDVLLFNRQPTLHKPSIMAFRARVLPNEKGFRLHYANCKSFNADFDGDEMNAHFPQSELARSEAYNLASVNYQYLVPKDGSPLGGLIQDHVVAPCMMTRRDQFFDKESYNQLVFCALQFLDKKLRLEPPAIIRPTILWTGKQVITTIIKNCIPEGKLYPTLDIKSKISPKILNISREFEQLSDCHVIIRQGELVVGFMDKSNVGATQYGLIHTCYELYGGETSSNLMSAFARLSTWYLQLYQGFTLGIADILIEDDADADRQKAIERSKGLGHGSAKEALGIKENVPITDDKLEDKLREIHSDRDPLGMKKLDAAMKKRTDDIASEISGRCLPFGLITKFPDNNLQMMIQSGAKGGTVNALQISCLLGQIELEGRRVPLSMSGRSLPSYKPYDVSPEAGGFVSGRFLTGIQPQEFFFHCMAGREGLIDTAVKTSRSGYLQRCLIKHLEGLTVHYDQTVRDSCGSVIQFLYGEDGLDICKSQMLKSKAFPLLIENVKVIGPSEDEMATLNKLKEGYEEEVIARTDDIQQWLEQNGSNRIKKVRGSGFLDFLASKLNEVKESMNRSHVKSEAGDEKPPMGDCDMNETASSMAGSGIVCKSEKSDDSVMKNLDDSGSGQIGSHHHDQIFMSWYALSFKEKRKWNRFWEPCPDPLIAIMNPGSHFGVVPEKLDDIVDEFVRRNPRLVVDSAKLLGQMQEQAYIDCEANPELSRSILAHTSMAAANSSLAANSGGSAAAMASLPQPKLTKHEFYDLCYNLYMKMLAQPGEAVGLLAAQSIGEPSTQMTLNTFHFAGRGEMNVTLGIPRLREILMTASAKIGTPSMDLPLLPVMYDECGNELSAEACEEQAKRVKLALNAVRLSDVLEYVDISEQVVDYAAFDGKGESISGVTTRASANSRGTKRTRSSSKSAKNAAHKSVRYDMTFAILPSKYYKHEFKTGTSKVLKFIEEVFVSQLVDSMLKRQKRLSLAEDLYDLSSRRKMGNKSNQAEADDGKDGDLEEQELDDYNARESAKERSGRDEGDGSSSEDEDEGDGDNTTQRMRSRQNPDLDYEEPEEDDLEVGESEARAKEEEKAENDEVLVESNDQTTTATGTTGDSVFIEPPAPTNKKVKRDDDSPPEKDEAIKERESSVKAIPYVVDYVYDTKRGRWCKLSVCVGLTTTRLDMASLVSSEAKRTFVHRVGDIQRALLVKDVNAKQRLSSKLSQHSQASPKCELMVKTEGVSLLSLVKFNHILDLNAIYSNDIHAIARTYGIEAAVQAIRREMANVFAVYGIEVDSRHLSLIADYMTYNGSIRGMNRMSMEASASPFQQMSFESTLRYLKSAAILGLYDDIKSPSASLVFGQPTRGGTGLFQMLSDPSTAAPQPRSSLPQRSKQGAGRKRFETNRNKTTAAATATATSVGW